MQRKKKTINEISIKTPEKIKIDDLELKKPEWLYDEFNVLVEIKKITPGFLDKIEMVDVNGDIIIWEASDYNTNIIKLNNKISITGRAKSHITEDGVKKTKVNYLRY